MGVIKQSIPSSFILARFNVCSLTCGYCLGEQSVSIAEFFYGYTNKQFQFLSFLESNTFLTLGKVYKQKLGIQDVRPYLCIQQRLLEAN